jgi:Ca-activated chloride channel family protein
MRKRLIERLIALALLACAAQAHAGSTWSKLWRNADQRGEALLQQGDAKAAAGEFADPRRKSYAEFKAGDYAAAAKDLAAFDDSDAHYNRGNALAYAGDLQGALKAYDAALKRDPHNEDARRNRDVVEKALKQQQQQKSPAANNSQNGKQGDKQNGKQDGKQDNKQSGKQDNKQDGQGQSRSGTQNPAQQNQADNRAGAAQNKPGTQSQQAGDQAAGQGESRGAQQDAQKKPGANRNDAEQARRDAEASIKGSGQDQAGKPGPAGAADGHDAQTASAPLTEKQISQDQWLRSIPDDPGGLLRRKFLIEHMMRQQRAKP